MQSADDDYVYGIHSYHFYGCNHPFSYYTNMIIIRIIIWLCMMVRLLCIMLLYILFCILLHWLIVDDENVIIY